MNPPAGAEGDNARWFANKVGWIIEPGVNVILEGDHDVRYFRLADSMHRRATGRRLLGDGFHVLAAGIGDAGGTDDLRIIQAFGYVAGFFISDDKPFQMPWHLDIFLVRRIPADDADLVKQFVRFLVARLLLKQDSTLKAKLE